MAIQERVGQWEEAAEIEPLELAGDLLDETGSSEPAKNWLVGADFLPDETYLSLYQDYKTARTAQLQAEKEKQAAQRKQAQAVTAPAPVAKAPAPVSKPTTNGNGNGYSKNGNGPAPAKPRRSGGLILSDNFKGDYFPAIEMSAVPEVHFEVIRSDRELEQAVEALKRHKILAVDTETSGLDPYNSNLLLVQVATPEKCYIIDAQAVTLALLKPVLETDDHLKLLQNAKFDYKMLKAQGGLELKNMYDTMLAERLLTAGLGVPVGLADLSWKYLHTRMDKEVRKSFYGAKAASTYLNPEQLEYAAKDALSLFPIYSQQLVKLKEERLLTVADVEFKCVAAVGDLELNGCKLDTVKWRSILAGVAEKRDQIKSQLMDILPSGSTRQSSMFGGDEYMINLNSAPQIIAEFGRLGITLEDTSEATLSKHNHPAAKLLVEYKGHEKTLSAFGEGLLELINKKTGRIHPDFIQYGADTGRFSCSNPNVQQIPATSDFRSCFIAEEGYKLVTCDYSQAELRILAELSQDEAFLGAFKSGGDLHILAASQMFNIPPDQVTKTQRGQAKAINFGLAYGMGAQGLAVRIDKTVEEADELIKAYFRAFNGVQKWLDKAGRDSVKLGYSPTPLGRKRYYHIPGSDDPDYRRKVAEVTRRGKNAPIQGCLSGESRVLEEDCGYVRLESLCGRAVSVWDGQRYSKATVVYSGQKQLVKIELWGGHYIECSPDHRFLTRGTSGKDVWKTPGEFKTQDRIVLTEGIGEWDTPLQLPSALRLGSSWNTKNTSLDMISDRQKLGEWLGRLASDGTLTNITASLFVAEHEENILPELVAVSQELGYVGHNIRVNEEHPQRVHKLVISSRGLCDQLRELGVKERVPDCAWQDSRILRGYLRGMFDGDGTVHPDGALLTFGRGETHLEWAREIQQALLLFGIRSRLNVYAEKHNRINLRVFKTDMPLFCREIGFLNPEKQAKAEAIQPGRATSQIYGKAARVKQIEFTDQWIDMYDVVNSETERFMANGLVVHNCNADMTKVALVFLKEKLAPYEARIVNTVHDEIVVEVREDQAEDVCKLVEHEMIRAAQEVLKEVPVVADAKISDYWSK